VSTKLVQTTNHTDPRWPVAQANAVQAGWIQTAPAFAWAQSPLFQASFAYAFSQAGLMQADLPQGATFAPPSYTLAQAGLVQPDMIQAQTPAGWPCVAGWTQTIYKRPAFRLAQKGLARAGLMQGAL
jgi:hypothetical protein